MAPQPQSSGYHTQKYKESTNGNKLLIKKILKVHKVRGGEGVGYIWKELRGRVGVNMIKYTVLNSQSI